MNESVVVDPRPGLQGIVVDLDGLLIDSEIWSWRAHNTALALYGQAPLALEEARTLVGLDGEDEWAAICMMRQPGVDRHTYSAAHRQAFIELREGSLAPLPGVMALLAVVGARGWRLGLASNSGLVSITAALDGLGIRTHFAAIASAEEVPRGKPSPAVYQLAMVRLGIGPTTAIAIEDSATGLRAAAAAGMYCLAVPSELTLAQDLSPARLRFPSLQEVAVWLSEDGRTGTR